MDNKVALVTGASRGIGKAIALKLAEAGMDIALVYAGNAEAAEHCQKELEALGVRAKAYQCDVSDFEAVGELVRLVTEELGPIWALVNNAGITRDMLCMRMREEGFGGKLKRGVSPYPPRLRRHDQKPCRQDYQHHIGSRPDGKRRPGQLCGCQGRPDWADQKHRKGAGRAGNYMQRHCPRLYRNGYDCRNARSRAAGHPFGNTHEARRACGRCSKSGSLSCL